MKLIIREYLASLKEREELDAILPDLLSELGYTVYSRPRRGTTQHGVDIAAVGKDDDGQRKLFLFSVKRGDLTRQDWDGSAQSLRASLNEIRDAYIPSRIPTRYKDLDIVICLCFGGDVQEQVRAAVSGYIEQNTTDRVSFDEWNGDKIAGLILQGVLREEILPKTLRSSFQKAVAMVDEPDVAYDHFTNFANQVRETAEASQKARVTAARQLYVCLWILFVWARDIDNVEAPYRASELAILNVWHLLRSLIGKKNKHTRAITAVLHQLIQLHLIIAFDFLERKIFPHVGKLHALSTAVNSQSSVDINLKLFDLLGRIAMTTLWLQWFNQRDEREVKSVTQQKTSELTTNGFKLIHNNPILFSPLCDQQAIDIALFLQASASDRANHDNIAFWLRQMVHRVDFAIQTHGNYPCVFTDYRDLVSHPRDRSNEYRKEAMSGSILIPLLAAWIAALKDQESLEKLVNLKQTELEECTLQLWLPDSQSEDELHIGAHGHGVAILDLVISPTGREPLNTINEACKVDTSFETLSPIKTDYWPVILLACRHYRHPVPPQFWVHMLLRSSDPIPENGT